MPRYAILLHDHPFIHWDLLLEHGPVCLAWRLMERPDHAARIEAQKLPDHRLMYLDYEGLVSGDRGSVKKWDVGTFEWLVDQPQTIRVKLAGCQIHGDVSLSQIEDLSWQWYCEAM